MRKIKFRAWNEEVKEMWEVVKIDFWNNKVKIYDDKEGLGWIQLNDIILMQYTGLKDRNGEEIYEGDILLVRDKEFGEYVAGYVVWDDELAGFYINDEDGYVCGMDLSEIQASIKEAKVIGNIYKNPDLLKNA